MADLSWEILEYPGCLQSCVWGWRELHGLALRFGSPSGGRLILIPPFSGGTLPNTDNRVILESIRGAHREGAVIAAVCAGSAWIAAAGIDGGRELTTHWSLAPALAAMGKDVRVAASELVIDHGDVVSAGGLLAWVDLGLHLVERFWSRDVARSCARTLVWEPRRRMQTPYAPPGSAWIPLRPDPNLAAAVAWISAHFRETVSLPRWAAASAISVRTLQRRWTAAFGIPPVEWMQKARTEEARRMLEATEETWESITAACGYRDAASFRVLFERETGWTPGRYRAAYGASIRSG